VSKSKAPRRRRRKVSFRTVWKLRDSYMKSPQMRIGRTKIDLTVWVRSATNDGIR
jgi:hypothetical protein